MQMVDYCPLWHDEVETCPLWHEEVETCPLCHDEVEICPLWHDEVENCPSGMMNSRIAPSSMIKSRIAPSGMMKSSIVPSGIMKSRIVKNEHCAARKFMIVKWEITNSSKIESSTIMLFQVQLQHKLLSYEIQPQITSDSPPNGTSHCADGMHLNQVHIFDHQQCATGTDSDSIIGFSLGSSELGCCSSQYMTSDWPSIP